MFILVHVIRLSQILQNVIMLLSIVDATFLTDEQHEDIDEEEDWKEAELRFNMLKDTLGSNKKFL